MFLYNMCKDYNIAEELTQETFFQVFKSFGSYKGKSDIFTWLAAIAKHTYYKYMRKNKITFESLDYDMMADMCIDDEMCDSPENSYIKNEFKSVAKKIIGKLPQKYKDVVILRVYAELSFGEIAKALDISEGSAKVMFFRAKKMLREEFDNEYGV